MMNDFIYALRSLNSRPLVSTIAILSLALGIGVNTAIFSVLDRLVLRRLPVPAPEGIVNVTSVSPRPGWTSTSDAGRTNAIFSYPLFRDLEQLDGGGLRMAAHRDFNANLSYRGRTADGEGVLISGHYFSALGITPALGRPLGPEDDRVPGAHPLVVLSHAYWSTSFGSDPGVLDDTLIVNGEPMTIVGVLPPGFSGNTTMDRPDVFVPLAMAAQMFRRPDWTGLTARNDHWLYLFARLGPGVSRDQAESLINVPFAALTRDIEFPALRSGMGDLAREQFQRRRLRLEDGSHARNADWGEVRMVLMLMFAVTGFVLAIACANVANLLLARVVDRSAEMSVRLSIGASSGRLLRMLLVEACVLGVLGSAAALIVARLTLGGVLSMMPAEDVPMLNFEMNRTVLLFTLALGLATSLLFGLFPALHGIRTANARGLSAHSGRVSGTRTANRFRASLATTQVALATALLSVAGLFIVSLVNVARVDLGIERDGLITFSVSPYLNGYSAAQSLALFERLEEELTGVPGVVSVSATSVPILANTNFVNNLTVEGFEAGPDADTTASFARTGTDYFRTLGIPLLAGRDFSRADRTGSPQVAIVNEAFARRFNLGANAVGRRMALGAGGNRPLNIEIVGLVRDAPYSEVKEAPPAQFYMPYRQADAGTMTFYVRTSANTRALLATVTSVLARLDGDLPIVNLRTMDEQIRDNTTRDRVLGTLSSSFAALATLLAAIGLYAVLAYGVAQRLREFGIRIALGAQRGHVRWLVLSQVMRIGAIGGVIGAGLAFGLGRVSEAMLFGVAGSNIAVIGGAVLLVLIVTLAAGTVPARRATAVNPIQMLRNE
jgi:predicted permease